jgi:hypothetical protein
VELKTSAAAGEPVVVCTYGPSGIGKTTDMGYSFPRALFLAAPGALNSVKSVCGYAPDRAFVATIEQATEVIEEVGDSGKYRTVVIDDFSFMAEQTFSALEADKRYSGFKLWGKMRDVALSFRDKSRYSGVNVILNCWEQPPKSRENGALVRGGPQLSGKLPEQIPALCDVVLRATIEKRRKPWPAVYRCSPDPSYVMKDRFNVATVCDPAPMNLAELLRASGAVIPRHPDMEGQEEQVQTISESLSGKIADDASLVNEVYASLIRSGISPYQARWTLRDAVDRAVIRSELGDHALSFFDVSSNNLLG